MTAKEKALELFNDMLQYQTENDSDDNSAKFSALICVDEILKTEDYLTDFQNINDIPPFDWWKEVKQELNKL